MKHILPILLIFFASGSFSNLLSRTHKLPEALTFDDLLLKPRYSEVLPKQTYKRD